MRRRAEREAAENGGGGKDRLHTVCFPWISKGSWHGRLLAERRASARIRLYFYAPLQPLLLGHNKLALVCGYTTAVLTPC